VIAVAIPPGAGIVTVLLAIAGGISVGFTMGRFFERWEFVRKGYRLPPPDGVVAKHVVRMLRNPAYRDALEWEPGEGEPVDEVLAPYVEAKR